MNMVIAQTDYGNKKVPLSKLNDEYFQIELI